MKTKSNVKGIASRIQYKKSNSIFGIAGLPADASGGGVTPSIAPGTDLTPASSFFKVVNGAVFAVDNTVRANGMTPDQMGLPYAMQVLSRGAEKAFPGIAAAWWASPPVTFWLAGSPYALPEPNTLVGGAVPLLPVGLMVQYASVFAGQAIPPGMPNLLVVAGNAGYQNKLRMSPNDITGYPGSATSSKLSANSSFLLCILEAAFGPVINAFSAYPYASDFGGSNNIDDKMFNHRNSDDLLQPSVSKSVLQTVSPIAQKILSYIPGVGTAAGSVLKSVTPVAQTSAGVQVAYTTPAATTSISPFIIIGGVIVIVIIIIILATRKS